MILPHRANPRGYDFRERQVDTGVVTSAAAMAADTTGGFPPSGDHQHNSRDDEVAPFEECL